MKKYLIIILCLTATAFGINKRYLRPQVNTVGLVAHYKLWVGLMATGKVFDYSLNGHVGTLNDTDTPITLVPIYPGFDFDGSNDYIEIADHNDFSPGDGSVGSGTPFSISAWIYMHDATTFEIASKGVYNTDCEWIFEVSSGDKVYFQLFDESKDNCFIGRYHNTALTDYQTGGAKAGWIYLVATSDGGSSDSGLGIYLNDTRVDDTNFSLGNFVAVENLNHAIWIGRYDTTYADGLIDNVMIFNKELSAVEIKNIYEVTKWRYE